MNFDDRGFRCNPFKTLTPDERIDLAVLPPAIQAWANEPQGHLQLLGPMGCGKTMLLYGLIAAWENPRAALERIPEGAHRFETDLRELDWFLLDEAQRLNWMHRRRLLQAVRHGLRLALATHADYSRYLARLCTFQVEDLITPEFIVETITRRISYFAHSDPPSTYLTDDTLAYLWQRFGPRQRNIEDFLYEVFQTRTVPGPITAQDLDAG